MPPLNFAATLMLHLSLTCASLFFISMSVVLVQTIIPCIRDNSFSRYQVGFPKYSYTLALWIFEMVTMLYHMNGIHIILLQCMKTT